MQSAEVRAAWGKAAACRRWSERHENNECVSVCRMWPCARCEASACGLGAWRSCARPIEELKHQATEIEISNRCHLVPTPKDAFGAAATRATTRGPSYTRRQKGARRPWRRPTPLAAA